jgi:serine protease DegQ
VGEYAPARLDGEAINPRLTGATLEEIGPNSPLAGKVLGVLIAEVASRSPAARAGLRKGDVILAINQQRVASPADLQPLVANRDTLLINLLRGQQELVLAFR